MNYDDYLIDEKLFISKKRKKPLALRQDEMRVFNLRQQAKQESAKRNRIQRVELSISTQLAFNEPECPSFTYIELRKDVLYGSGVYVYTNTESIIYIGSTGRGIQRPAKHLEDRGRKIAIRLADRLLFFPMPDRNLAFQVEYCLILAFHPTLNLQVLAPKVPPELDKRVSGYVHQIKEVLKGQVKLT